MILISETKLRRLISQAVENTMSAYSDAIVSLSMAVTDLTVATNAAVQKIVNTSEPIGPDAAPIMAAVDQVKAATAALSAAVAPPAPAPAP